MRIMATGQADRVLGTPRSMQALDALHDRLVNYDDVHVERLTAETGWRHETRCQELRGGTRTAEARR